MSDIEINVALARDIVFRAGRLTIVRGSEARAQRVHIALLHFMGEWFMDQNAGTNYLGAILGKGADLARRAEFRRRLLEIPGITAIESMNLTLDPSTRRLSGVIEVTDSLGNRIATQVEVD